jgi:hypothetical protein
MQQKMWVIVSAITATHKKQFPKSLLLKTLETVYYPLHVNGYIAGGTQTGHTNVLDLNSNSTLGEARFLFDVGASPVTFLIGKQNNNGTGDVFFQALPLATGYGVLETWNGMGTIVATGNATPIVFKPNRTEAMRILSSGNVGIGMGSFGNPGSKLVVQGSTTDNTAAAFNLTNSSAASILFARNDGNIGIGTTSPATNLEVSGALRLSGTGTDLFTSPQGSNVPTKINIPLLNPGGYGQIMIMGLPSSAPDTARAISFVDNRAGVHQPTVTVFTPNENNVFGLTADGSNTTGYVASTVDLGFKTGGTERMHILSSGFIGIGTSSPSYDLHVVETAGLSTGTAWTNASDIRLKDIHGDYEYGLNEILKLHTVRYSYKKDNPLGLPTDFSKTGFIAQEVQKIIPDAVNVRKDGYLELNVDPIHWAVVNAIKDFFHKWFEDSSELHREVASLKAENTAMKEYLCKKDPEATFCK